MATSVEHRRNSGDTLDVFLPICMQALDLGSVMITGACPHSDATSTCHALAPRFVLACKCLNWGCTPPPRARRPPPRPVAPPPAFSALGTA
eukprot:CAMPEP_0114318000 /NCGR_PEP_ID=MMETSP0059-20121206/24284_1 /TAXON_ID=36894 /ORGANISM="Pyramimonas parkeae, Strain CCMP726" /LENGTH=90 /DNA_ID=CAMNT_0001444531 /DNA_START=470 /DNA_END=739 /DNA_ORIENTATION=+